MSLHTNRTHELTHGGADLNQVLYKLRLVFICSKKNSKHQDYIQERLGFSYMFVLIFVFFSPFLFISHSIDSAGSGMETYKNRSTYIEHFQPVFVSNLRASLVECYIFFGIHWPFANVHEHEREETEERGQRDINHLFFSVWFFLT